MFDEIGRRELISGLLALATRPTRSDVSQARLPDEGQTTMITCFIRYQIDPFQLDDFRVYADNWGRIIPRCGGHLVGYFLPHEGTNDIAWGLIAFDSLAAYETYRERLRKDPESRANFAMAQKKRLVLREERTFLEVVKGTFELPPNSSGKG